MKQDCWGKINATKEYYGATDINEDIAVITDCGKYLANHPIAWILLVYI
jgi:hypothetical protein